MDTPGSGISIMPSGASPSVLPKISTGRSSYSAKKLWRDHSSIGISTAIDKGNIGEPPMNVPKPLRHPARPAPMPKPFRILHCRDPAYGCQGDGHHRDKSNLPQLYAEMTFLANAVRNSDGTTSYKSLSKKQQRGGRPLPSSARSCPGRLEGPITDLYWSSASNDKPHPRMLLPTSPGRTGKLYAWQMAATQEELESPRSPRKPTEDAKLAAPNSGRGSRSSFLHSVAKKRGQTVVSYEQNGRQRFTLVEPPPPEPDRKDGSSSRSYTYGTGSIMSSSYVSNSMTSRSQESMPRRSQESLMRKSQQNVARRSQENIASRSQESILVRGIAKVSWNGKNTGSLSSSRQRNSIVDKDIKVGSPRELSTLKGPGSDGEIVAISGSAVKSTSGEDVKVVQQEDVDGAQGSAMHGRGSSGGRSVSPSSGLVKDCLAKDANALVLSAGDETIRKGSETQTVSSSTSVKHASKLDTTGNSEVEDGARDNITSQEEVSNEQELKEVSETLNDHTLEVPATTEGASLVTNDLEQVSESVEDNKDIKIGTTNEIDDVKEKTVKGVHFADDVVTNGDDAPN